MFVWLCFCLFNICWTHFYWPRGSHYIHTTRNNTDFFVITSKLGTKQQPIIHFFFTVNTETVHYFGGGWINLINQINVIWFIKLIHQYSQFALIKSLKTGRFVIITAEMLKISSENSLFYVLCGSLTNTSVYNNEKEKHDRLIYIYIYIYIYILTGHFIRFTCSIGW